MIVFHKSFSKDYPKLFDSILLCSVLQFVITNNTLECSTVRFDKTVCRIKIM